MEEFFKYSLVEYYHYVSCHSLAYMEKYGEDERDILDNYVLESESVQNLLKESAELDIITAEDVIIAVGASSPYVRETQERFLVGCVNVISEWRDRKKGRYEDSYYDPIVRLIFEIEEIIEKMQYD